MTAEDPYARLAPRYDRIVEPMLAGTRRIAHDVLPPQPTWRVLDVGCGTGTAMVRYLEAGCSVVGVDTSAAMLDQARSRLGERAELVHIAGGSLPFDDDEFDLVHASMVLHEVAVGDRVGFMSEMRRVARHGGRLLVVDFRFGSLRGWRGPTFRALSWLAERSSGHYEHYRTFKEAGGVPGVLNEDRDGFEIAREKIVGGGNISIYVVAI